MYRCHERAGYIPVREQDASKAAGFRNAKHAAVIPVATGMALTLTMCALREQRPSCRKVIFLRIDQKSCVKSVLTAGFELVVVDNVKDRDADEVSTDLEKLEALLNEDDYVCVLSTTSCFAPRIPDRIPAISALCAKYGNYLRVRTSLTHAIMGRNKQKLTMGHCFGKASRGPAHRQQCIWTPEPSLHEFNTSGSDIRQS
mmetsp:Transcript_1611/g.5842  ORF Transcript_1611/g.5842 Transcript_1611/m.5842 type:complete len:200 (-) Transcript_1611:4507-5106(-)